MKRKDFAIRQALAEKQQLVADILHIPREEFETIAELAGEPSTDKEASELVLAAVNQGIVVQYSLFYAHLQLYIYYKLFRCSQIAIKK